MKLAIFLLFCFSVVSVKALISDDDIPGKYRTIVFIQPGPADDPIDLQEKGGYMEFNFKEDFRFEAKLFIPALPDFQMEKTEMSFQGTYSVDEDTIRISGTNIFLDTEPFIYNDEKIQLKNKFPGLMELVLEKVKE